MFLLPSACNSNSPGIQRIHKNWPWHPQIGVFPCYLSIFTQDSRIASKSFSLSVCIFQDYCVFSSLVACFPFNFYHIQFSCSLFIFHCFYIYLVIPNSSFTIFLFSDMLYCYFHTVSFIKQFTLFYLAFLLAPLCYLQTPYLSGVQYAIILFPKLLVWLPVIHLIITLLLAILKNGLTVHFSLSLYPALDTSLNHPHTYIHT